GRISRHNDSPLRVLAQDLIGPRYLFNISDRRYRDLLGLRRVEGCALQCIEIPARCVIDTHHYIVATLAFNRFGNLLAIYGGLESFSDLARLQSVLRCCVAINIETKLRYQDLFFDLHVSSAGYRTHDVPDLFGLRAQGS